MRFTKVARFVKLLFLYAKDYWVFSFLITLIVFFFFYQFGTGSITTLIWFKLIANGIGLFIHYGRKASTIYFYMNNGLGKYELPIYAFFLDLIFWITGMVLIVKFLL